MTDGRTDRRTDGQTDGRTDGGDCNIPDAFLKKRGDNNRLIKCIEFKVSCDSFLEKSQDLPEGQLQNGVYLSLLLHPLSEITCRCASVWC